jgi:hypothetical protein
VKFSFGNLISFLHVFLCSIYRKTLLLEAQGIEQEY